MGSNGGVYFLVGLIVYVLLEAYVKKDADDWFKNLGKFTDEKGNKHDTDYYFDSETNEYKKL